MMQDRQEFSLTAIKVKEDLVVTVVPNKKSGKVHHITIPAEDLTKESLDADLIGIIGTPIENKAEFSAQTSEVEVDEEEEEEEEEGKKGQKSAKTETPTTKPGKKAAKADKSATESAPKKTRGKGKQAPSAAVESETAPVVPAETNNAQEAEQNEPEQQPVVPEDFANHLVAPGHNKSHSPSMARSM